MWYSRGDQLGVAQALFDRPLKETILQHSMMTFIYLYGYFFMQTLRDSLYGLKYELFVLNITSLSAVFVSSCKTFLEEHLVTRQKRLQKRLGHTLGARDFSCAGFRFLSSLYSDTSEKQVFFSSPFVSSAFRCRPVAETSLLQSIATREI